MRISLKSLVTSAGLVLVMGAVSQAQKKTVTQPCKDGTTSTAVGKGACSGHGGVDGAAKAAQEKAAHTAKETAKKAAKAEEKGETKAQERAEKAAEKTEKAEAKMVKCTDGTESKGGRGACSGHGGIAKKAKKSTKKA